MGHSKEIGSFNGMGRLGGAMGLKERSRQIYTTAHPVRWNGTDSRKRVLFVAEAVTLAHVGRVIALARGLDHSRYIPLFAWDDRFDGILGRIHERKFSLSSIPTDFFLNRLYNGRPTYDFETLDRYVKDDLNLFKETTPDYVVGDTRFSLSVSAAVAGIPFINVVNAHWSPYVPTRWVVPHSPVVNVIGPRVGQWGFDLLRPSLFGAYAKGFDRLFKKWGRPERVSDLREIYCAGDRTVYPDLPDLIPIRGLPSHHRFLGPVTWSPETPWDKELSRPAVGKKTVYVATGTSGNPKALPAILEGLAGRQLRVLVAGGSRGGVNNPAPDRLELHVSPYFSGDFACKTADLVVHNGGSGSINQCLVAGVPFLGVASNLDQFSAMYFPERAGLGKTVRGDRVGPREISTVAGELLDDPAWGQRAQVVGRIAQSYRPSDILMNELEKINGRGVSSLGNAA